MIYGTLYFFQALAVALIAGLKGYNPLIWFIVGFFIPPVPLILITFLPPKSKFFRSTFTWKGSSRTTPSEDKLSGLYMCAQCGKLIPINTVICPYCGRQYDIIETKCHTENDHRQCNPKS